jgi:hypothetical protein
MVGAASTDGAVTTGPESPLVCGDGTFDAAVGAPVGTVLAAMAAAAIASGGVAPPAAGGRVAGVSVGAVATEIATAIGFGVVTTAPICGAWIAGSVEEAVSEAGFSSALAVSVFEAAGFALDPEAAALLESEPATALALEAGWVSAA